MINQADPHETISLFMRARVPLTFVSAIDELRVEKMFLSVAEKNGRSPHVWSITRGFQPSINEPNVGVTRHAPQIEALNRILENRDTRSFLLKDFHVFLRDAYVIRALKELSVRSHSGSSVFLIAENLQVPPELAHHASYIEIPLQSVNEIKEQIHQIIKRLFPNSKARHLTEEDIEWIANTAVGMTELEIENACAISLISNMTIDPDVVANFRADLAARKVIDSEDAMPEGS